MEPQIFIYDRQQVDWSELSGILAQFEKPECFFVTSSGGWDAVIVCERGSMTPDQAQAHYDTEIAKRTSED